MKMRKSISSIVRLELTSAEPEMMLDLISDRGIELLNIQKAGDLIVRLTIRQKDLRQLTQLCQGRGAKIEILQCSGLYWMVRRIHMRPVILTGAVLLVLCALLFPRKVFFVQVEGNEKIPQNRILEAAEEQGIKFGASRREVRSEKVKNGLLSAVPELQWAGVNTAGCVAIISVKERSDPPLSENTDVVSSIVASRDGYILSAVVTQGHSLIQEGQSVKEGQVLISGYTDLGICIRATPSEGEVFAQTRRNLKAVQPMQYIRKSETLGRKRKISLLLGKKRINLWKDSGILDTSCGRMYEEYCVALPGGFQLPISLCIDTYLLCETDKGYAALADAEEDLTDFAGQYLMQDMVAGRILERKENVLQEDGFYALWGSYVCTEMIGRVQKEQIGDIHGKDS